MSTKDLNQIAQQAVELAAQLLNDANRSEKPEERAQSLKMEGMMRDPNGKNLTMVLSDQAFRSQNAARVADQIKHLTDLYGMPEYFAWWEKLAMQLGNAVGSVLPGVVVPAVIQRLRQETHLVIRPAEEARFKAYLNERYAQGTRLNVNHLGEAVLGEGEAAKRLESYLKLLQRPDVEYISVKLSSVFSQVNLVAAEETVVAVKERLRTLYRAAMKHTYHTPDGRDVPKFVNLDMEEYRDLHLTVAAFRQVLDEPEFLTYKAGIVLQAYLPDSARVQEDLTAWAIERVGRGGAPIKIRLVKGANLAMEQVEASSHGWELATYDNKPDVDANYKRMVVYGCQPKHARAAHIGIASHNLFDLAFAMLLRDEYNLGEYIEFEMLEGMANHQARAVQKAAGGLLLYAPIVKREDFRSAIAYLIRRLDENTAEDNFLHDLFGLKVDSRQWHEQKNRFLASVEAMEQVSDAPNRTQNRHTETIKMDVEEPFRNEPDTDWAMPANQAWVKSIVEKWRDYQPEPIPLQIGGEFINLNVEGEGHDPSRPGKVAYRYALATPAEVNQALDVAVEAQAKWAGRSIAERKATLVKCAEKLAQNRGEFIGGMMLDGGKRVQESDPEISEAIDFASYYARSLDIAETELADCDFAPLGVVVVTPPWNFPLAIPTGGVLSALMAGNTVILKPAPEATLVGWQMVNALWDAGVPKEVLQFLPTPDNEVGQGLVTDERVGGVILTGGYPTGQMFLSWKPEMRLFAETSGKNGMIITAMADHDQAVKDLVKSAFGHNGQKCSASSLAVLEAEVYDNPAFMRQLKDAAASLKVGAAWELDSTMTPVIREPGTDLKRALTTLEPGESWLLEPKMVDNNPNLWSPGIKLGVKRGSFFHKTECFGPVLGLIRAENLQDALEIVNDTDFGLTSGLQSLDDREIAYWRDNIEVGNAYINRGTTGAIVQRQPFGGWKKSAFGYAKAGGPNYVLSLGTWTQKPNGSDEKPLGEIEANYRQAWQTHFGIEHDPSQVLGEENVFRYRPLKRMVLRVESLDDLREAEYVALATKVCDVPLTVSVDEDLIMDDRLRHYNHLTIMIESEASLIERLQAGEADRLRVLRPVSLAVREAANAAHVPVVDAPVLVNGRLELRHYLREQSVTNVIHRYGNINQPVH